jgi:membrane protease YdiL (CAAX protease family)
MEQENPPSTTDTSRVGPAPADPSIRDGRGSLPFAGDSDSLQRLLFGNQGMRVAWSVALFGALFYIFREFGYVFFGTVYSMIFPLDWLEGTSALTVTLGESVQLFALVAAAAIVAKVERRPGNLLAFNLAGPRKIFHFTTGLVIGFAALSALIGGLAWGGWLRFGPVALSGAAVLKFGLLWALAFLTVGFFEEGAFRCYLQFTLTRGINFWWALGAIALIFCDLTRRGAGNGIGGVYLIAALGLIPCLLLERLRSESSGFWQAAWVTSTFFGAIHTWNRGENWIGIFAAASVGFALCVSVKLTGSAWWAIGFHAAWDWAETYFYGTPDSGLPAKGHLLTTNPAGAAIWSGGTDGPEGSLLIIPLILLLLLALLALYGRGKRGVAHLAAAAGLTEQATG